MKTLAVLAVAALAIAGCASPVQDSEPVDHEPAHVLTDTPSGNGSLGMFLDDYAPDVLEPLDSDLTDVYLEVHNPATTDPSIFDSFLDYYVPEDGE